MLEVAHALFGCTTRGARPHSLPHFLQAKPLTFLHVFHHTSVVPMAYLWLEQGQSLQQIALLTNTGIHVIMYW